MNRRLTRHAFVRYVGRRSELSVTLPTQGWDGEDLGEATYQARKRGFVRGSREWRGFVAAWRTPGPKPWVLAHRQWRRVPLWVGVWLRAVLGRKVELRVGTRRRIGYVNALIRRYGYYRSGRDFAESVSSNVATVVRATEPRR